MFTLSDMRFIVKNDWSGGRDLNLRHSGVCTLGRLGDLHPQVGVYSISASHELGQLGSSTKLSYRPTSSFRGKIMIYVFRFLEA